MKASRTDYSRGIDWSAVKTKGDRAAQMRRQVVRFVGGIRSPREAGVTKKQILAWFHGTPAEFVDAAIGDAVAEDEIGVFRTALVRRSNERHVYEITDKGRKALEARSVPWDHVGSTLALASDDLETARAAQVAHDAEALSAALDHLRAKIDGVDDRLGRRR